MVDLSITSRHTPCTHIKSQQCAVIHGFDALANVSPSARLKPIQGAKLGDGDGHVLGALAVNECDGNRLGRLVLFAALALAFFASSRAALLWALFLGKELLQIWEESLQRHNVAALCGPQGALDIVHSIPVNLTHLRAFQHWLLDLHKEERGKGR